MTMIELPRVTRRTRVGDKGRKCTACGMVSSGRMCWDCRLKEKQSPLAPCIDCGAPLHRRTTPSENRLPGSKSFGSAGRCTYHATLHRAAQNGGKNSIFQNCVDCGVRCRGTRCRKHDSAYRSSLTSLPKKERERERRRAKPPMPKLRDRYPVPTPSIDSRPLTERELDDALCPQVDTEIFFAELGEGYHDAKRVCFSCPIKERCLAVALANNELYGVFGGSSPPERKRILRERKKARELERPTIGQELSTRRKLTGLGNEGVA